MTDSLSSPPAESPAGPTAGEPSPPMLRQLKKFFHMVRKLCGPKAAELYRAGYLNEELEAIIRLNGSGAERMPGAQLTDMMHRLRDRYGHDQEFMRLFEADDALPEVPLSEVRQLTAEHLSLYQDRIGPMAFDLVVKNWQVLTPPQQKAFFWNVHDNAFVDQDYPNITERGQIIHGITHALGLSFATDPDNPERAVFYRTGDRKKQTVCTARNQSRSTSRLAKREVDRREIEAALRQMTQNDNDEFDLLEGAMSDSDSSVVPLVDTATQALARPTAAKTAASVAPEAVGLPANPGESSRLVNPTLPALPPESGRSSAAVTRVSLAAPRPAPKAVSPAKPAPRVMPEAADEPPPTVAYAPPRRAPVSVPVDPSSSAAVVMPRPVARPAPASPPPRPIPEPSTKLAPTTTEPAAAEAVRRPASGRMPATGPDIDPHPTGRLPSGHISGHDLPALMPRRSDPEPRSIWRGIALCVALALVLIGLLAYAIIDICVGPAKPRFAGLINDPSVAAIDSLFTPDPVTRDDTADARVSRNGPLTLARDAVIQRVGRQWHGRIYLRNNRGRPVDMKRDVREHSRMTTRVGSGELELVAVESWVMADGKIGLRYLFTSGRESVDGRPTDYRQVLWEVFIE